MGLFKCPYLDTDERCKWRGGYCKHYQDVELCDEYSKQYGKIAKHRRKAFWLFDEVKDNLSLEQLKKIIKIMEKSND